MRRREITVFSALCAVLLLVGGWQAQAQLSGSYTINSAVPTGGTNYQTFTAAVAALVAGGVSGPVVFDVAVGSGPYTEYISIGAIGGVSSTNTVTFNGNGNTLQHTPTSSNYAVLDINGGDYITFDNLTVKTLSASYGIGFRLRNQSDYITIQNCTIDLSAVTNYSSSQHAFVASSNSLTSCTTSGNNANYCTVQNNTMLGYPYYGVTFYGSSSSVACTNVTVSNNTLSAYYYPIRFYYMANVTVSTNIVTDFHYYGIYAGYTATSSMTDNDISRPTRTTSTSCYGIYLTSSCTGVTVAKNKIHNFFDAMTTNTSTAYGIYISATGTSTGYNLVKNNIIYNMNGAGEHGGIYLTGANYVQIYHNTISLDNTAATSTSMTRGIYSSTTSSPGPDCKNNVISITRGGTGTKYAVYLNSATSTLTSNYNDLYVNSAGGGNNIGYKGAAYTTWANWQGLGYDANSVSVDPTFENPSAGNLKPQEITLNDIGTDLSTSGCMCVTDDILGNARTTTPDPGAYEFTPSAMTVTGITTTQTNTNPIVIGATDQLIIGIEVTTNGMATPLSATQFSLSTNGSTSAAVDIGSAKLYYTGTSAAFATTTLFGSATAPSGAFAINGTQTLAAGVNYFWLAYDIASGATNCDVVDAECSSVTISTTPYTPSPTAPTGNRALRQAFSGAYTVNSAATPGCGVYTTLGGIISDMIALGVSGPVTVTVATGSGPYTEHLSIPAIAGASSTNTITFNGNGNTLQYGPSSSDFSIVDMNGCDNVIFSNFTVKGTDPSYGACFLLRNAADSNTIQNCTLDMTAITSTSSYSAYVATTGSLASLSTSGNNANYLTVQNNTMIGAPYYGVTVNGSGSSTPCTNASILNNTMQSVYYYGIRLYYMTACTVQGNTVEDWYYYGMYLYYATASSVSGNDLKRPDRTAFTTTYGIYVTSGSTGVTIEKNRVHNLFGAVPSNTSTVYALAHASTSGTSSTYNLFKNNAVYDMNGEGALYGLYNTGSYAQFYHNTISLDNPFSASTSAAYGVYTSDTIAAGLDVKNNIISITRTGAGTRIGFYVECWYTSTPIGTSNYNDIYVSGAGTNYIGFKGNEYKSSFATLAAWQGIGYDANSVSTDPYFENPSAGNCKPQAAAVNDIGTNLSTSGCTCVTDDILGGARSTMPDPGAWEFSTSGMTLANVTTTQTATGTLARGATDQQIIGVQFQALGALAPLTVTGLSFTTAGSTSAADLTGAKLWYTGTSSVFATTTQYGSTVANPSGAFSFAGSTVLTPGTHYFWLTYDIASTATPCNVADATCDTVVAGIAYLPSPSAPAGSRMIKAPLSGAYTVSSVATPGCTTYTSIRDAVADVNTLGVSGPVTFNVAAGHTETSANIVLQTSTTNATNTLTFQKSGSGANPLITAAAGAGASDGIIVIAGTDYVTFDGIDVQESTANTVSAQWMEWGYAVLKGSATDGAQHVTIENCAITLTRAYTSNYGVYQYNRTPWSTSTLTIATPEGRTTNTSYTNLDISEVTNGIYAYGYSASSPYTYYDQDLDVGYGGGNVIRHGGNATTSYGVYTAYVNNQRITGNSFPRVFNHTSTMYSIYASTAYNAAIEIAGNTIQTADSATSSTMYGIYVSGGSSGLNNTLSIHDNVVSLFYPTSTSGGMYGIYHSGGAYQANIYRNTISNCVLGSSGVTATGTVYLLYSSSSPTTSAGSAQHVYANTIWNNNRIQSAAGSGSTYYLYTTGSADTCDVQANSLTNNNFSSTSTAYVLYCLASGSTKRVFDNVVDTLTHNYTLYTVYQGNGTNNWYDRNRIANVAMTYTSTVLYGFYLSSGTNVYLANNQICDLRTTATTSSPGLYGIYSSGVTNTFLYYNTVYLNDTHGSATSFGSTGVYQSVSYALDMRNNIIVNTSTPGTTSGNTVAYQRSSTTLTTYAAASNNNILHAGTPAANRLIFYDGTNAKQTIELYRAFMAPRDNLSVSENPPFVSTATPVDVHLSTSTATAAEGGGAPISTPIAVTIDFDMGARDATWPDIGMDEIAGVASDLLPPVIAYTPLDNGVAATSRAFANVAITDKGGVNTTSGTRPRVYYKKGGTTNSNEWYDNTSATAGWKWAEANGTTTPYDFTIDYTKLPGGAVAVGDTIQYFVVAQDVAGTPNVGMHSGLFAAQPASVALTSTAFPIAETIFSYKIGTGVSGPISVGLGQTYGTLTAAGGAFEMLNASVLTGDVALTITSDITTEDGTNGLNQVSGGYRIQIQPDGTTTRTVSGSAANSLIRLNGADNVTIDGTNSVTPGRYLTFRNTNNSYPTMELLGNATNDRVLNCVVEGGNTSSSSGVLVFGAATTGNSNNAVIGCDIRDRSDVAAVPANLVYSSTLYNSADTVQNCLLHDYTAYAVYAPASGCGDGWQILTNGFYQTAARSSAIKGVHLLSGSGHAIVANNFGGSAADRSGAALVTSSSSTPACNPIYLTVGTAATTTVADNVAGNIECSGGGFYGIYITAGTVAVTGNRIGGVAAGSDTVKAASTIYGIYNSSSGTTSVVSADTVGYLTGTSTLYGYYLTNNAITATNNIFTHASGFGAGTMYGIYTSSALANTVTGNTVSDITSNGSMYGMYCTGTGATYTVASNAVRDITNRTTGTSALYGIYVPASGVNAVSGNTVERLNQDPDYTTPVTSPTPSLYGLYVSSGVWNTIANNTVDSLRITSTKGTCYGLYAAGSSGTVSQNTVTRLWSINNETPPVVNGATIYALYAGLGSDTLASNTVTDVHTSGYDSSANTFSALGLLCSTSTPNNIVRGNIVHGIHHHNAGTVSCAAGGMYVTGVAAPSAVERNTIYDITVVSTGTGATSPIIYGLAAAAGSNAVFSNNMISIGTGLTGDVSLTGIREYSNTGTNAYFYNTVYVGGTATAGTTSTAAFNRSSTSSGTNVTLRNNILFNGRSGGSNLHYAIANGYGPTNWTASDYNLYVSPVDTTVGMWVATNCDFATWKSLSGNDTYSLSANTTALPAATLFTSAATADLSIVTSAPECWYVNGRGIAGAASGSIADDYGATAVRSTTLGMATDVGADEFSTTATPPMATASAAPSAATTTTYSFGGQTMAAITWGTGGTVPTAIDFRYYPGDNPPAPLQGSYANAYATITATGGSGYTYDVTFGYSPAILGTIPFESDLALAKRDGSVWTAFIPSTVDTAANTVGYAGLTGFSDFTFTSVTSPLPVELVAFSASLRGAAVDLAWRTASESNLAHFAVERRSAGGGWEEIGLVTARGTTDKPASYGFTDGALPAGDLAYRLRMVERDGTFSYSDELLVRRAPVKGFALLGNYPNPFNPSTRIAFAIPDERHVALRVFDASGREVETLVSSTLPAGMHTVAFFARNLPSGVYRYVLTAGADMAAGRMMLVR
jgi:parallel beta-helix repeat protein